MSIDLAVVMPVYNEAECAAQVVSAWRSALAALGMRFSMIVINDGSTDGTAAELDRFRSDADVEVIHQPNAGHGPTVLRGYRRAVEVADWVFQCDSDDEISPECFAEFWLRREAYDALFGIRQHGDRGLARRIISGASRLTVRLVAGGGVTDVNVPFRLLRAPFLRALIAQIPPGTHAPNVIISGAVSRAGLRILQIPVPCGGRKTGTPSIAGLRLWKTAAKAFVQTATCRPRLERPRP